MDIEKQISKLNAEKKQIDARQKGRHVTRKKLNAAADKDQERGFAIDRELRRLKIKPLEGKANAVQVAYRQRDGDRCAHLNDAYGTLTQVRRTQATVQFDVEDRYDGIWEFPLDKLLPADATQGFMAGASMQRPDPVEAIA